tara:strand:- start:8 stop:751 length:744 start_codon:yes stop_codon:yes gene_type:complete
MQSIHFNSKRSNPPGFSELSNFYGGVEFKYMKRRFDQSEVTDLFEHLEACGSQEFWRWLQILNPKGTKKKPVTPKQMDYWFTEGGIANGNPIRGIAAKLLGTMVRTAAEKRRKVVAKELGIPSVEVNEELPDDGKRALMKECLRGKYSIEPYRSLLLSTGSAELHEIPLRGNGAGNNWTYKEKDGQTYGKNWLGQLLMEIRADIAANSNKRSANSNKRSAEGSEAGGAIKKPRRVSLYKQYVVNKYD